VGESRNRGGLRVTERRPVHRGDGPVHREEGPAPVRQTPPPHKEPILDLKYPTTHPPNPAVAPVTWVLEMEDSSPPWLVVLPAWKKIGRYLRPEQLPARYRLLIPNREVATDEGTKQCYTAER